MQAVSASGQRATLNIYIKNKNKSNNILISEKLFHLYIFTTLQTSGALFKATIVLQVFFFT